MFDFVILRNSFCVLYGFAVALGFQTLTFLWDVAMMKRHISTKGKTVMAAEEMNHFGIASNCLFLSCVVIV